MPAGSMRPFCQSALFSPPVRLQLPPPAFLPAVPRAARLPFTKARLPNLGYRRAADSRSFAPGTGRPNPVCAWRAGRTGKRASGASGPGRTRAETEGPSPFEGGSLGPSLLQAKAVRRAGGTPRCPPAPLPHQKDGVADHAEQHRAAQEPSHHVAHLLAQARPPGHGCRCPLSSGAGAPRGGGEGEAL